MPAFGPSGGTGSSGGGVYITLGSQAVGSGGLSSQVFLGSSGTIKGDASGTVFGQWCGTTAGFSGLVILNATGGGQLASFVVSNSGAVTVTPGSLGDLAVVAGTDNIEIIITAPDLTAMGQITLTQLVE